METDAAGAGCSSSSDMDVDEKKEIYMTSCQLIKGRVTGESEYIFLLRDTLWALITPALNRRYF